MQLAILLSGRPGIGKTTVIRRVVEQLEVPAHGFYTAELRQCGRRQGFEIITLAGEGATLAHVDFQTEHNIGKYGVGLSGLDDVGVAAIRAGIRVSELVVIDEIGPMEILSSRFREAVLEALDSEVKVLGTVYSRWSPFTDRVKSRSDVQVITVTRDNRDELPRQILRQLGQP